MEPETYRESGDQMPRGYASEHEGKVAREIERRTSKIPSDVFLWAAGASMIGSLVFQVIGMRGNPASQVLRPSRAPTAMFVGMWAPTLLMLGVYNKIVKVIGSDRVR